MKTFATLAIPLILSACTGTSIYSSSSSSNSWGSSNSADNSQSSAAINFPPSNTFSSSSSASSSSSSTSGLSLSNGIELISNGAFTDGFSSWNFNNETLAELSINHEALIVNINEEGKNTWSIQVEQSGLNVEKNSFYEVSFSASATAARTINVYVGASQSPWTRYSNEETITLNTELENYRFTFNMASPTDINSRIAFDLGGDSNNITIDNISVKRKLSHTDAFVHIRQNTDNSFTLYRDGSPYYIKGIGGWNRVDEAAALGANSLRTWHTSEIDIAVNQAKESGMTVLQGLWIDHEDPNNFFDEEFKNAIRQELQEKLDEYKDSEEILMWAIGNELNLKVDTDAAWQFVNELAGMIQNQDPHHPVATVIHKSNPNLLNRINALVPNIDIIGVNAYGTIGTTGSDFAQSQYNGPYMITEWGPTGHWEVGHTAWGRPLEQNSSEKVASYTERYNYITSLEKRCIGSYVFYWGQKQERTPTWYSMIIEDLPELGINQELSATVDAMERAWSGQEPANRAPNVAWLKLDDTWADWDITLNWGETVSAEVNVSDPDNDELSFVWEILREPTELGFGGSFEPRPERIDGAISGNGPIVDILIPPSGEYRLFVYVFDGNGKVGTANVPFLVR